MKNKIIGILGVHFDNFSLEALLKKVEEVGRGNRQVYFCTPNPEILLLALKNSAYRDILNQAEVNIADGVGILWAYYVTKDVIKAGKLFSQVRTISIVRHFYLLLKFFLRSIFFIFRYWGARKSFEQKYLRRVTGVDLMKEICLHCEKKIFLLGGAEGVAKKTAEVLKKSEADATFVGFSAASNDEKSAGGIIEEVSKSEAEILFVAFGAPKQEEWIFAHLAQMPSVKLAIGVGGSFDFISGHAKRAPTLMAKMGLEWLYRLFCEPWRIRRIYNAVIVFPWKIYNNSLRNL